jgi:hypothetical protein
MRTSRRPEVRQPVRVRRMRTSMCGAARWWSGTTTNCNPGPLSVAGDKVWIAGTLGDVAVVLEQ